MKDLFKNKWIVVMGLFLGIGWEIVCILIVQGVEVFGVDINKNFDYVEEFYCVDLFDFCVVLVLIDVLLDDIDGLVNNVGLLFIQFVEWLIVINLLVLK